MPHPRKTPRIDLPLTADNLKAVFSDCADFKTRWVYLCGDSARPLTLCYIEGMAKTERFNDYIMKPLSEEKRLSAVPERDLPALLVHGGIYTAGVSESASMDEAASALINGSCALFLGKICLLIPVPTEEKRSIVPPDNEPALKGSRDSFVESLRTNTSLVRRRLRAPELKVKEQIVGRQTLTPVDVVYLEGIADPDVVGRLEARLDDMDVDGVESAGDLEEYLVHGSRTPFPLMVTTQRPDRFCRGLLEGRVGLLADGLPIGWLMPGTLEQFFRTGQDRAYHWMVVSVLRLLRYLCALTSLFLPGLYIALVTFHPEAIPAKLSLSIAAAKQEVPFSTIFEVLTMLLAFEVVQEAGLRFPGPVGATVSILGGLVVGNAAVEAHIVSPAVLIAVAIAGVAGYTAPSQELSNALRLWRFLLAVSASLGGLFGLTACCGALILHLAGLETFGVPYLAPFTAGDKAPPSNPSLIRLPLPWMKWRNAPLFTRNRRCQR